MSQDQSAAEPDIIFRLCREADGWPGSDEGALLRRAADEIRGLREALSTLGRLSKEDHTRLRERRDRAEAINQRLCEGIETALGLYHVNYIHAALKAVIDSER